MSQVARKLCWIRTPLQTASYLGLVRVDMSFKMGKRLAESAYGDCYATNAIANMPQATKGCTPLLEPWSFLSDQTLL